MNVAVLRNELSARVNHLSYDQMLLVRGLMDSFGGTDSASAAPQTPKRTLGDVPGRFWMSDDFDATPECFAEYM